MKCPSKEIDKKNLLPPNHKLSIVSLNCNIRYVVFSGCPVVFLQSMALSCLGEGVGVRTTLCPQVQPCPVSPKQLQSVLCSWHSLSLCVWINPKIWWCSSNIQWVISASPGPEEPDVSLPWTAPLCALRAGLLEPGPETNSENGFLSCVSLGWASELWPSIRISKQTLFSLLQLWSKKSIKTLRMKVQVVFCLFPQ